MDFQLICTGSDEPMVVVDAGGCVVAANAGFLGASGGELSRCLGQRIEDVVGSGEGEEWRRVVGVVVASGRSSELVREEAGRVWRYALWPVGGDGGVGYVIARGVEETGWREKLGELARWEKLANVVPGMVYSFQLRPDGRASLPFCTGVLQELWGFSPEGLREDFSRAFARIHPEDLSQVQRSIAESAETLRHWRCSFRVLHPERGERWLEGNSAPQRELDGSVIWHGFVQDITARHEEEAALHESEERVQRSEAKLRAIFEKASVGIAANEPERARFIMVNPRMCSITGYTEQELLSMDMASLTHPEDRERDSRLFERLICGEVADYRTEKRYVRKDGEVVWVNVNATVVRGKDGEVAHRMATIEDITQRKLLEAALQQTQKLEAVGQLAGGVAHDFNNILASMMMQLDLLRMGEDLDDEVSEGLKELSEEARRAAALTRQLLMFSRRSVLELKPLDLNVAVEGALKLLRRLIGEHVRLQFEGQANLPRVVADMRMMEQVMVNLAVNSRDAMPNGGSIVIRTAQHDFEGGDGLGHPARRAGRFVSLQVMDSGCGMDEGTKQRLFEPFFSTKPLGKGTGLGLATVHGIAAQHHGWVEVETARDRGTTMRVFIPVSGDRGADTLSREVGAVSKRGQGTVLVVEDEENVRVALGRTLRSMGYTVFDAENGQRAMKVWQEHGHRVDLLITDMVMPEGMTGLELAEKLMGLKSGLKVVISSGYSSAIAHAGVPTEGGIRYLPKPYDLRALGKMLDEVLGPMGASPAGRS